MSAGPRIRPTPTGIPLGFLAILTLFVEARSQDRGSLSIGTTPDSATVTLDGSREGEHEKTPYLNESMIPGPHTIHLVPRNPAHRSATYRVVVEKGQVTHVSHQFEHRTKSHGFEHLSIAPWRLSVSTGIDYRRAIGIEGSTTADPEASPPRRASGYPTDSTPSSVQIPLDLRIGLPFGVEGHFHLPSARRTFPDGSSEGMAPSDVSLGLKWTYSPINSAIDLAWDFGNSTSAHLADGLDALEAGLITDQSWKWLDLVAEARYRLRFANSQDITPGDVVSGTIRPGLPLARDRFLPYVAVHGDYAFAGQRSGVDLRNESYVVTVIPGIIWHAGTIASFEFGIPLALLASNAETSWGASASISLGVGLAPRPSRSKPTPPTARQPDGVLPPQGGSFVLFDSHEATNADYADFCRKTGRELPIDPDIPGMPGYASDPRYGDFPVVNMTLDDARAYAKWKGKRLPTVSEWTREYAEVRPSADLIACGLEAPEAVMSRRQSHGIFHAAGNVAEWVEDDRGSSEAAYHAGAFYSLPIERCLDRGRWIDISAPSGAKFIGIRLVTEVR